MSITLLHQLLKEKEKQTRIQRDRAEKALELYDLEKENREKNRQIGSRLLHQTGESTGHSHEKRHGYRTSRLHSQKDLTAKQTRSMNAVYGRVYVYKQRFQAAYKHLQNAEGYDSEFLLK